MAAVSIDIPAAALPRVLAALHYSASIPDPNDPSKTVANPQTGPAFLKAFLAKVLLDNVAAYEANRDAQAASVAAQTKASAEVTIS